MEKIQFAIVTPERTVYESAVDEIYLSTPGGEIGILPHHIPLVSVVSSGEIRIKKEKEELLFSVGGGFLEVQKTNSVILLADVAERAEEISIERAENARKRAEELIQQKQFADDVEFVSLQASLERSLARLKVVKKHRRSKK